ncbi:Gfo/Idh/MocA family protein [Streptomyces sp. NPDC001389]|uniref:Gfo/Idh/MocA family protein n=1 Tax=Streptomyces sp. NPDC001389 TaxID=3364569 RepID=UPI003697EC0B
MRTLLVGVGEVGSKHLAALAETHGFTLAGVVDPVQEIRPGVPVFADYRQALAVLHPELVIVATPPGVALDVARHAARAGATVLVEKPVTVRPEDLAPPAPEDGRIFVAFQPHFAPGLPSLLAAPASVTRAEVTLNCRRDPHYFREWRRSYETAGGILHQQAIHGVALALRLLGEPPVETCSAELARWRGLAETEDSIRAEVQFVGGASLTVAARVDSDENPRHDVVLHHVTGEHRQIRGRNLEAGTGPLPQAPTHELLRSCLYRALRAVHQGEPAHPSLFPLSSLRYTLEVIDHVYRAARHQECAPAA